MNEKDSPIIWGMIHIPALPGYPFNEFSFKEILKYVLRDAMSLYEGGITHFVLENFGDSPFFKTHVPPHTATLMTSLAKEIYQAYPDVFLGINVLRNDGFTALAIAKALEHCSKFIRVNVLTGTYLTDQGIIESDSAKLLRYRKLIKAEQIEIWADVNVKHATPIVSRPLNLIASETLKRGGASKIIITGTSTGSVVDINSLKQLSQSIDPELIVIGSGIGPDNIENYLGLAQNMIVGTSLKIDNITHNPVDKKKVIKLINKIS